MRHEQLAKAFLVLLGVVLGSLTSRGQPVDRQEIGALIKEYLTTHPEDIGAILGDYIARNPEPFKDAFAGLINGQNIGSLNASLAPELITANGALLFSSSRQVTLGNNSSDTAIVEFFDYNCGYCRGALADMLTLLKDEPKLKFVLKELPVLGKNSLDAARVAIAVRMQDQDRRLYLAFHQKLLGGSRRADKDTALQAARDAGADMERLTRDVESPEVQATIAENLTLARAIGVTGTPAYVSGVTVIPGAIGASTLRALVQAGQAKQPRGF
jgi:protein-disulfide isomerase